MSKFFRQLKGASLGAGGLAAVLASGSVFAAEGDLSSSIITELSGGKTEILAVGGAVLVLVGVVALIRHVRAAAR